MKAQIPWLRVFVEGVVIVGSILLALGLDEWREGVQDREEEQQALEALAREFESAAVEIDQVALIMDSVAIAAHIILGWTGPSADSRHADSLALLLPSITRVESFQPPLGTLQALLGSGDLRLIRNDSLRAALASFPSRLVQVNMTMGYGADVLFGELLPYLNQSIPMRRFGRAGDGATQFDSDVEGLLRSLEFENLIQGKLTTLAFLEGNTRNVQDLITSIRAIIDLELTR